MAKKYNCNINGIQYFRKTKVIGHDSKGRPVRKNFYGDGEKDSDKQIEEYIVNVNRKMYIFLNLVMYNFVHY